MEELLNKLIEKGWEPFGKKYESVCKEHNKWHSYMFDYDVYYIREITSKESLLWQFVCMNKLENPKERKQRSDLDEYNKEYVKYSTKFYEYWLIESALCDEDKLEQFILDNIKVS